MKKTSLALIISALIAVCAFLPLLWSITDPRSEFNYGDFFTVFGEDSAKIRKEMTLSTFSQGTENAKTNRFVLIAGLSIVSDFIEFSDGQFHGILILVFILIGCFGIYRLVNLLEKDEDLAALLILILVPFYLLNFWAVDRIIHLWIWFTYATFPLFISFGLTFFRGNRDMITYSLLLGFTGFIPHSMIYLFSIHIMVSLYHLLDKKRLVDVGKFIFLPTILFILLNMPSILLGIATGAVYPISVSEEQLGMLSRNGELINALAFSNGWWPQVPDEEIFGNLIFRISSIMIFALVFFTFATASIKKDRFRLAAIAMAAVLAILFAAQGTNNRILGFLVDGIGEMGLIQIFAPFREWARLSILIPVFLSIIFIVAANKRKKLCIAFAALLLINLAATPAWSYINKSYSAIETPEQYLIMKDTITGNSKTIIVWPEITGKIFGTARSKWNTEKTVQRLHGIGEEYGSYELGLQMAKGDVPKRFLDSLNIRYVIKRHDVYEGDYSRFDYGWLECEKTGWLELCINDIDEQPFRIYHGTIESGPEDLLSLAYLDLKGYAPSEEGSEYVVNGIKEGKKSIFIFEAEEMGGNTKIVNDPAASRNKISGIGKYALWNEFESREGNYSVILIGNGNFTVRIDGKEVLDNAELDGGRKRFYIDGNGTVDALWIIEDELKERKVALVEGYERLSQNHWRVNVTAQEPFILGFAETYSSNFEARIYQDGKISSKNSPIRIYGGINGFRINETGKLEVEILHTPQEAFDLGLIISWLTFTGCVFWMVKK